MGAGGGNAGTPEASLECTSAVGAGANSVVIRKFRLCSRRATGSSRADGSTDDSAIGLAGAGGRRRGLLDVAARLTGAGTLSGKDAGAVACKTDAQSGDAILYWSHKDDGILVKATNLRGDSAALYDFFEQNARFIAP